MLVHCAFAFVTVIGSWLLLPMLFALTYASEYYGAEPDRGLAFPATPKGFEPDHTDFLYFAFTIAVTAQTSDVGVTTRPMRRLVLGAVGAVVRLQHDDPGVLDQRRGELLLALGRSAASSCGSPSSWRTTPSRRSAAVDQPADRERIEPMLLGEHAPGERPFAVVGQHRHHGLADDRPVVEVGGDEMDARAR